MQRQVQYTGGGSHNGNNSNNNNKKPRMGSSGNSPAPTPNKDLCRNFLKGSCSRADCRFAHQESSASVPSSAPVSVFSVPSSSSQKEGGSAPVASSKPQAICYEFQTNGACSRGGSCKFAHVAGNIVSVVSLKQQAGASAPRENTSTVAPKRTSSVALPEGEEKKSHISNEEFRHLNIAAESKRALSEVMKYQFMTVVQAASLPSILQGKDCLAKAKTGTGKTLAFLIPAIEFFKNDPQDPRSIPVLILSPTRELATQIGEEAKQLLTFHKNNNVVTVFGGTKIEKDKREFSKYISILVAAPGRLRDHLENTPGFVDKFKAMKFLILDEADQLLEMGFKPEIDRILSYLPPASKRQTLLFSATVPPLVQEIAKNTLRPGYSFIDTVGVEVEQTHAHVEQQVISVTNAEVIPAIYAILLEKVKSKDFKIIVFFTTANVTAYMGNLFQALNLDVLQIHSRLSQSVRTKTSDNFRLGKDKILFSSDVSARGMDYPDVTFVLQVGSTEKSQYIHRLGRTARAGKEGSGCLLLCDFEERSMMQELKDMPLKRVPSSSLNLLHPSIAGPVGQVLGRVDRTSDLKKSAKKAYQAWLGYYNGKLRACGWDKRKLVEEANAFSRIIGLSEIPGLQRKTIGMMGLKGTPGLRIAEKDEDEDD